MVGRDVGLAGRMSLGFAVACVVVAAAVPAVSEAATRTKRASLSSSEAQGDGFNQTPSISGDGRYVAFQSFSDNLVSGDTNGHGDIFVRGLKSGKTRRASVTSAGDEANGGDSYSPSISADGRFVAFRSDATNLVS